MHRKIDRQVDDIRIKKQKGNDIWLNANQV